MERLTKHIGSRAATISDMGDLQNLRAVVDRLAAYEDIGLEPSETPTGLELAKIFAALQELKRYKDAEKQGLIVRLPCKVGDTVYSSISWSGDYEWVKDKPYCHRIVFIGVNGEKDFFNTVNIRTERMFSFSFEDIGKTVFLTRKAAEAALAKMTDSGRGDREKRDHN